MSVVGFTLLLLTIYLLAMKSVSYFAYRISKKNTEDYFLAGRGVGTFALVATTVASIFSTGTVVAGPSEFFTKGSNYFWIFFFILLPVLMMPLALKFWKLGKVRGYITPSQMMGDFYKSKTVHIVAALIGLLTLVPYATAQMVAVGKTFNAMTDGAVPYEVGVSIMCIAIGLYIWYGGSRAVIWTDAVQGVIFSVLLIITGFLAVKWAGGWDMVMNNLTLKHSEKATFDVSFKYYEYLPMCLSFFFLPHVWQRSYMARSATNLVKTIAIIPFVFLILFFIAWLIGMSALTLFPNGMEDGDSVLGAILNRNAPYFGAFVLVAAFAAGMSTVDSQLLSAGAIVTHDIKRKIIKRRVVARLRWRDNYKFARMVTMFLLLAIYVWSLTLQEKSIFSLIILGVSLTVIFLPVVIGIFYWKRASTTGATVSMIIGLSVFLLKAMTPLGAYFPTELGAASWTLLTSSLVFIVVSLFTDSTDLDDMRTTYAKILK